MEICAAMLPLPRMDTEGQLDQTVNDLIEATQAAVEEHTPPARPCPYSKRWFTPDLKKQQVEVNRARRKWQDSCARRGRNNIITLYLFTEMRTKRREWTRTIERAKATHWKEFLDQAGSGNLWKAARYMEPGDNYANIPPLVIGQTELTENKDKAKALMESFFPQTAEPAQETPTSHREETSWEPITEIELMLRQIC
jgi:hypothetical protein